MNTDIDYLGLPTETDPSVDAMPPDEHRTEITQTGRWTYAVQLVTTCYFQIPGKPELRTHEMCRPQPAFALGRRWAESKARRLLAAARREQERKAATEVIP